MDEGAELMIDGREVGSTYIWTISQIFYKVENETCEDSLLSTSSNWFRLIFAHLLCFPADLKGFEEIHLKSEASQNAT